MSRTVWIIDAAYLEKSSPDADNFDYLKLKTILEEQYVKEKFTEAYYLNGEPETFNDACSSFHAWLKSATNNAPHIRVKLYPLKMQSIRCPHCHQETSRDIQRAVDVGIATLMIRLAVKNRYDRLLLSTGDGDFEEAISYVKDELDKEVWISGYRNHISPDLQSYADRVIWLNDFWLRIRK